MLVLTRRIEQSLLIGDNIEVKILQVRGTGGQAMVRLGIVAPADMRVLRQEVFDEVKAENRAAADAAVGAAPGALKGLSSLLVQLAPGAGEKTSNK